MGRYDKIKTWNGSSWVQPTQIKVWNGSSYTDYGANDSDNTNSIYTWDGSTWQRMTLNKKVTQTGTNYGFGGWVNMWPQYVWSESNGTYFAYGDFNCTVPAGFATWQAYSSYLVGDFGTGSWWAGSQYQANVWYNFYWRRPNKPFWIHNIGARSTTGSYWAAQPSQYELWHGDRGTYVGLYYFWSAGAATSAFWTSNNVDYKPNGGMTSFTVVIYDGAGWKHLSGYCLRMGCFKWEAGDATSTPVYTTTWE